MNESMEPGILYLDYNATTPVDPRVAEAMLPYLTGHFGNPSSGHALGRATRQAVDQAREQVAGLLEASPGEIIFTSGGTESNNHALVGAAEARRDKGNHILISAVEHPAVTAVCEYLATRGFETTLIPVDRFGMTDPAAFEAAMTDRTILVSIMHANNEVGTIQPVRRIADIARNRGILSHSDCAQSTGKIPVGLKSLGVDMLSVAGHKLYAPKGVGVLAIREGVDLPPFMHGAEHEKGRRAGTENVLLVVGLGRACELANEELETEAPRLMALRDSLQEGLTSALPAARVHGHPTDRLPNTLSIGFPGLLAEAIMARMPGVAVSAGAACHGGGIEISHVLKAMEVPMEFAQGTLRLSVGRMTSEDHIDLASHELIRAVQEEE